MKTNIYLHETTTLDKATGEVETLSRVTTSKIEREDSFVKLYVARLSDLKNLQHSCCNVLWELVKRVDYTGNVCITAGLKRIIATDLGMNPNSVTNAITKLVSSNILHRIDTGMYLLNPHYFAKGSWYEVQKQRIDFINMSIKFSDKGEEILVETVMKEEIL